MACGLEEGEISSSTMLCGKHFLEADFYSGSKTTKQKFLKNGTVPRLFLKRCTGRRKKTLRHKSLKSSDAVLCYKNDSDNARNIKYVYIDLEIQNEVTVDLENSRNRWKLVKIFFRFRICCIFNKFYFSVANEDIPTDQYRSFHAGSDHSYCLVPSFPTLEEEKNNVKTTSATGLGRTWCISCSIIKTLYFICRRRAREYIWQWCNEARIERVAQLEGAADGDEETERMGHAASRWCESR